MATTHWLRGCAVLLLLFNFNCFVESKDYARSDLKERYGSTNGEEKDMPEKFSNILDEDVNYLSRKRKIKSRNQRRKIFDPSTVDLVVVIDKHSRRGSGNFYHQKRFIEEFVEYLPIFPAKIRVAAVSIASRIELEFDFNKFINKECTAKAIRKIRYDKGKSTLKSGLDFIFGNLIFESSKGARSNARKLVIVFSENPLTFNEKAGFAKQRGVQIVFVNLEKKSNQQFVDVREILSELKMEDAGTLRKLGKLLGTEIPGQCQTGKTVYDKCLRRCKCVDGKLQECCRLRVPFTEMTKGERKRYIEVIKTASTHRLYKERYETMLTMHKTIFRTGIHKATFFLPWHRWFILQYENLLREIDCRVTVPYWESAEEANDALASDVWNAEEHGLGGNGTGSSSCVQDGPFRAEVWSVIQSAGGGCLTRNFNGRFPNCITVIEALLEFSNASSFDDFEEFIHREFHDAVHCVIGGQMCSDNSATSPEFFLHHGFVDKLWSDWQRQSSEHTKNEHFVSQTLKMPATDHLPKELLELQEQPGCVCVEYRDPGDEIYQTLKAFTKKQIKNMPRVQLPAYPERARKLFDIDEKDIQRMKRVRSFLQPAKILREEELTGKDRILGFRKEDLVKEWARGLKSSRARD